MRGVVFGGLGGLLGSPAVPVGDAETNVQAFWKTSRSPAWLELQGPAFPLPPPKPQWQWQWQWLTPSGYAPRKGTNAGTWGQDRRISDRAVA